ncbi:MAG: family 20 glycosylhydrolase, partial [Paramuribaculum sp.]|nr:family 20 glycosylhydrolase [Paramuribaculum sp.]
MKIRNILTAVTMLTAIGSLSAREVSPSQIIPRPMEVSTSAGSFTIPADGFTFEYKGKQQPELLTEYLNAYPAQFHAATKGNKANLIIEISNKVKSKYELKVTPSAVIIKATDEEGAFYAIQSLLQMAQLPEATEIVCSTVTDSPRFPYRGVHFDVSRHFRSIDFLKKQIDAMALLKLNKMHLHLTDGAGWRMQIDAYPRLAGFAAWRPQLSWQDWVNNGSKYCDETDVR